MLGLHSSHHLCYGLPGSSVKAFTTHFSSTLLIQNLQDVFGNLPQLMSCLITLLANTIEENHALVTFMTWRFILKRAGGVKSLITVLSSLAEAQQPKLQQAITNISLQKASPVIITAEETASSEITERPGSEHRGTDVIWYQTSCRDLRTQAQEMHTMPTPSPTTGSTEVHQLLLTSLYVQPH